MKRVGKTWLLALGSITAIALGGCTSPQAAAVPYVSAEHESLQWADGSKIKVNRVDLKDATKATAGKDFTEIANTAQWALGADSFGALGLDAKGNLFGAMSTNQGIDPATNALTGGTRTGMVEGQNFTAFVQDMSPAENSAFRQTIAGDSDGKNFVWVETADTSLVASSWELYSKPANAKAPILIASSVTDENSEDKNLGMGDIQPVIHGDRVYWHETTRLQTDGPISTKLRSTALAGNETARDEASDVAYPASLAKGLAVFTMDSDPIDPAAESEELVFQQPVGIGLIDDSGTVSELLKVSGDEPADSGFGMMKGSGNSLTFSFNGETLVVDTVNKQVVAFEEPADASITGLAHCGDLSTWSYKDMNGMSLGAQYVYNVKDQTLRSVNEPGLFGTSVCQKNYLGWSVHDLENDGAFATEVVTKWND